MTAEQVREAEFQVCQDITFISAEQIKNLHWIIANKLVADIDPKDTHYVALNISSEVNSNCVLSAKGM